MSGDARVLGLGRVAAEGVSMLEVCSGCYSGTSITIAARGGEPTRPLHYVFLFIHAGTWILFFPPHSWCSKENHSLENLWVILGFIALSSLPQFIPTYYE